MTGGDLPDPVAPLAHALVEAGFVLAGERGAGEVNRVLEYQAGPVAVRLTGDRGQWWADAGPTGDHPRFDADVWAWCLDGQPPGEPTPLGEQVRYFADHRDRLAQAAQDASVLDCLDRRRAQWARERMGFPPST